MAILVNTLYAILTWCAVFALGVDDWLGWALLVMACIQSWGTFALAVKQL